MKARILFFGLHRPGRSPSQRFRFEQYIDYLREQGFECEQGYLLNAKQDKIFYAHGKILQKGFILLNSVATLINYSFFKKYDVIYVQREAFMLGSAYFEKRFGKRAKLVYDFDDAIFKHQTGDIKSGNKALYFLKNPLKTQEIIAAADMVLAGNTYLADFARQYNKQVRVIPTTLDCSVHEPVQKQPTEKICIGWSGSFSTIVHLEPLLPALRELKNKYGDKIWFKVMGDARFVDTELGIQGIGWQKETELSELAEMDIGVMPLPDDEWTKGKCGFKGLLYMSLAIPAVLSPVGVNTEIINDGENGFLAGSQAEWVEKLSMLIDSFELREKLGKAGRQTVEQQYSVNANKQKYLKAFEDVLKQ